MSSGNCFSLSNSNRRLRGVRGAYGPILTGSGCELHTYQLPRSQPLGTGLGGDWDHRSSDTCELSGNVRPALSLRASPRASGSIVLVLLLNPIKVRDALARAGHPAQACLMLHSVRILRRMPVRLAPGARAAATYAHTCRSTRPSIPLDACKPLSRPVHSPLLTSDLNLCMGAA